MQEFDTFFILCLVVPAVLFSGLVLLYKFRKRFFLRKTGFLIIWNSWLLALLFSIIFLGSESYFRFFVDTTDSFGLNKITQRWMHRHYKPNNFNARDNVNYDLRIEHGKRRITFFGDSFTAGHGIKDVDNRFPNLIRIQNPGLEIHVLADNGMESINQLNLIRKLISDSYQFDLVALVYNLNDISYLLAKANEIYDRVYAFNEGLNFFGKNSYFVNTMLFRYFAMRDPDIPDYYDFVEGAYFSEAWNRHAEVLKEIKYLTESKGGKLLVVNYPFFHDQNEDYKFLPVHEKLEKFWNSLAVPYIDLEPVFKNYDKQDLVVNKFDAHPNEFANSLVAETIDDFIKNHLQ